MSQTSEDSKPNPQAAYEPPLGERAAMDSVAAEAQRHDPYAALRLREFRLYALGWLFTTMAY